MSYGPKSPYIRLSWLPTTALAVGLALAGCSPNGNQTEAPGTVNVETRPQADREIPITTVLAAKVLRVVTDAPANSATYDLKLISDKTADSNSRFSVNFTCTKDGEELLQTTSSADRPHQLRVTDSVDACSDGTVSSADHILKAGNTYSVLDHRYGSTEADPQQDGLFVQLAVQNK